MTYVGIVHLSPRRGEGKEITCFSCLFLSWCLKRGDWSASKACLFRVSSLLVVDDEARCLPNARWVHVHCYWKKKIPFICLRVWHFVHHVVLCLLRVQRFDHVILAGGFPINI